MAAIWLCSVSTSHVCEPAKRVGCSYACRSTPCGSTSYVVFKVWFSHVYNFQRVVQLCVWFISVCRLTIHVVFSVWVSVCRF